MSYIRDTVIVLKSEPFREHDSWLTFYGREQGKMIAVARGARRWEAKQLGHLEPFSEAEIMIAQGESFDKVAVAKTVSIRPGLRQRLSALVIAGTISSLVERLTHPGVPDETVYHLLQELLRFTNDMSLDPSIERARLFVASITLRLLDALGYALQLEHCITCQRSLQEPIWFLPETGGMVCGSCVVEKRRRFPHVVHLPGQTLRLLRFVRQSDLQTLSRLTAPTHLLQAISMVMDRCVEHHAPLLPRRIPVQDPLMMLQEVSSSS